MTISTTMLDADFAVMTGDWGSAVTVQGNDECTGIVQELNVNDDLGMSAYDEAATLEVVVKAADVATLVPVPGNTVAIGSDTYRIINVLSVTGDTLLRLECGELSK
jgi:hypothetical protein